jgi:hypothetical protein
LPVSVHADGWWLSVLPIAQASVLRWVLMGGISTNQRFFWHGLCGCVLVLVRRPVLPFLGGVVLLGTCPGRGWWGLCLAHCWVLRQQDLFAAMQGGTSGVSFVPASGTSSAVDGLRFPLWGVGCGGCGLVDGVVV